MRNVALCQVLWGVDIAVNAVVMPADAVHGGRMFGQHRSSADITTQLAQRGEEAASPQNRVAASALMDRE